MKLPLRCFKARSTYLEMHYTCSLKLQGRVKTCSEGKRQTKLNIQHLGLQKVQHLHEDTIGSGSLILLVPRPDSKNYRT